MDINEIIGTNIQTLRNQQNLSIGQLAEKTGLSKAVISQIEKGKSNPTINTIWKLASALHVPYSAILETQNVQATKVAYKDLIPQLDEEGHYRISCYYSTSQERNFELFLLELDPDTKHTTSGHTKASQEYIVIKKGKLSLITGENDYILEEGDSLFFDASLPHTYTNLSNHITEIICINYYPEK